MDRLHAIVGDVTSAASRPLTRLRRAVVSAPAGRHRDEGGQGLAEYALILAFIAIAAIAALIFFGEELFGVLSGQIGSQVGWVVDNMP
jgi:Flp pilus assembly pilin Flp